MILWEYSIYPYLVEYNYGGMVYGTILYRTQKFVYRVPGSVLYELEYSYTKVYQVRYGYRTFVYGYRVLG